MGNEQSQEKEIKHMAKPSQGKQQAKRSRQTKATPNCYFIDYNQTIL